MTGAGPTPAGDHEASPPPQRTAGPERGYRRLLFFYPAAWRESRRSDQARAG